MTHYIQKYDAKFWPQITQKWPEITDKWPDVGSGFKYLIQAAFNKHYWLQPNKTAQNWVWLDSENGNDVQFYCPQTVNPNALEPGSFYYIFAQQDLKNPIAAFELHDVMTEYSQAKDSPYVYRCIGKTWRSILDTDGIVVSLNESKISFKDLCKKLLAQIKKGHIAFKTDDTYIDDDPYVFSSYKARCYASEVIKDLESYGYRIWFDANLKMHAVKNDLNNRPYTITAVISKNEFTLSSVEGIRLNERFEYGKVICRIDEIVGNNIKINKYINVTAPQIIYVTNSYIVDWDFDNKISNKDLNTQKRERPISRFNVKGDNIISTNLLTDSFVSSGLIEESIYSLTKKPAQPSRNFVAFDTQSSVDETFDFSPAGPSSDTIVQGRLKVNNLATGNYGTQYRNYKDPIDANGGITLGASLAISQNVGNIALLGLKASPGDGPGNYLAGFSIFGASLKVIYRGVEYSTSFSSLIATVEREITNISIAGSNSVISVNNADSIYTIGQTVLFQLNGESKNFGTIISTTSSSITVDRNVTFVSGMKLLQQADYILKIAYYNNSIIWYAKKGTDTRFTIVRKENLSLSGSAYIQLYANNQHSISFDFADFQENLSVEVKRTGTDGATRSLDIAFEDSASYLQGEVEIYEDDDEVWKVKFDQIEDSEAFLIELVISPSELLIRSSIARLGVGDRILVNNYARTIISRNESACTIVLNQNVPDISINSPVYKTDTTPGKGETLEIIYKPVESISLPLCGNACASPASKATKIIKLELQQNVPYDVFRTIAQDEVNKACLPEPSGSFEMLIQTNDDYNLGSVGIFRDVPSVGQRLRLRTRGTNNNQYDELESTITEVKLESIGHPNGYKCSVTFGEQKDFTALVSNLKRELVGQSKLINEDLPAEDLICIISESINISENQPVLSNIAHNPFKSGLHKGCYISGVV
jgi:hypothetical protein